MKNLFERYIFLSLTATLIFLYVHDILFTMNRIGVMGKARHPMLKELLQGLKDWLVVHKVEVMLDHELSELLGESSTSSRADMLSKSDLIVVLGGDGTLLSVARFVEDHNIPIIGVNLGTLGFLTEITLNELYTTLEKVLDGDFKTEERIRLDIGIIKEGKEVGRYSALNDIVINRGTLARILDLEIYVDDLYVTKYRADGLIVSTPTGSTAYSLAAGGPIIYPTTKALILSPICPHNLTNRPIVIPDNVEIKVNLVTRDEDVMVTVDGQIGFSLNYRDFIRIKKSTSTTVLVLSPQNNYYQILREKLKWGERIGQH